MFCRDVMLAVDDSTLRLSLLAAVFFLVSLFVNWYRRDPLLDDIPTIGFSDPILSYFSALRFTLDGLPMLKHGYQKTRRGLFKIATFRRWMVLASGPEMIEDVRKAPDDTLFLAVPVVELLQPEYTMDQLDLDVDYHAEIIRLKLNRGIAGTFPGVHEELVSAFEDCIPTHGDDWVKVPVIHTMQRVVCQTTNRMLVGSPLCRDRDYLNLNLDFSINIIKFAAIISIFPKSLKPVVSRVLSNLPSKVQQEMEFIEPMIKERFAKLEEFGEDWDEKPNDMLMWLMEAKGKETPVADLARQLLAINFGAIHTTSLTFTNALYRLISNPEYVEPLRKDVEAAVAEEGWTKAGIDKMYKVDSFLRESQRVDALGILSLVRLVLRPFTFSNGVTVPVGTQIAIPSPAVHADAEIFPNPDEFDGFRFAKLCERDGDVTGHQATSTSPYQFTFGYGRHACPGRFFAVNGIKALLAHVVVTYDIKFEEGERAPPKIHLGFLRIPGRANAMFRRRQK